MLSVTRTSPSVILLITPSCCTTPSLSLKLPKLHPGQRLGQYVRDLLICSNVMKLHSSLLHHVTNVLVFDLNMLGFIVKHQILRELDATLIITIYTSSLQLEIK